MSRAARAAVVLSLAIAACSGPKPDSGPTAAPVEKPAARPQTPLAQLPPIDTNRILADIQVLASDRFEGRAPGSKGEELTVAHLVDQFKKAGLEPGNVDGTYVQKVPLVGITPEPAPLVLAKGSQRATLKWKDDVVAWTKHVAEAAAIDNSEVVFVGYGVVAPEFQWDDYKGVDVKGKTLLMLVNDPPVADAANPAALDDKMFGGRAMTYYGRWTYKYEIAAQKGAAGAIIIHETGPAGYPFDVVQTKVSEQFDLVTPDKNMGRPAIEAWISLAKGRALLGMAGQSFDELKARAATRDFKPVPLGVTASMRIKNTLRTIESQNVVAKVKGGDPVLSNEYVVYTAHWDHLGIGTAVNGDRIYNGAIDNASGTAALVELGRAFKALPQPPRRSILFLAVTAEEQGLLGSAYYSVTPIYPLAKTLANINMDELNVHGRTRELRVVGLGNSELDSYLQAALAEQGRVVEGDAEPEKGYYYRSDHFNFAKQGVPALNPDLARDQEFIGKPPEFGKRIVEEFNERDYHKPSDEVRPDWDLSGAREDLAVMFAVGYRVAESDKYPEWKPGTEFKALREAMLKNK
jgi:Zn-dependent M28 family amino/carboxypeptidase